VRGRSTAEDSFKKLDEKGPYAKASDIFKSGVFDPQDVTNNSAGAPDYRGIRDEQTTIISSAD
jgi:hypothetical protein